jgi:hypothetical protein
MTQSREQAVLRRFASRLEASAQSFSRSVEEHASVWVLYFVIFYLICTIVRSLAKPLWFDEIFTYYIAALPRVSDVIEASRLDNNPPLGYIFTHICQQMFGRSDLVTRLPSITGFLVLCVCLFLFVRSRCSGVCALVAMLFPLATGAYPYAYEARPYGIVLGLGGVALLSWQTAASGRRRVLGLAGLALSLMAAAGTHYYGGAIVFALALGDAVRTWEARRIDLPVWLCMLAGVLPSLYLVSQARNAAALFASLTANPAFRFRPYGAQVLPFYEWLLGSAAVPLLVGLSFYVLISAEGTEGGYYTPPAAKRIPLHEITAAIGFCLLPLLILAVSSLATGYFMDRYALPAVLGCTVLLASAMTYATRGRAAPVLVLAATVFVVFVGATAMQRGASFPLTANSSLFPKENNLPIAVSNPLFFLQTVRYGSPEVVSRVCYLTDREAALRQRDLIPELVLPYARKWARFNLEDYKEFLGRHEQFWVLYSNIPDFEWLPSKLANDGHRVELRLQEGTYVLYLVTARR